MNELEDGSWIQLRIGGMPNAVGSMIAQSDLKDLGIHTEMFVNSMADMVEAGRITGARKTLDKYKIKSWPPLPLALRRLMILSTTNPMCAFYPVNYTNDPFIIAQNDNVVAINNCVEVDLFG